MTSWQPAELLQNIAATGYFAQPQRGPEELARHLERRANISAPRAMDVLSAAGLVTVRYDPAVTLHPKDQPDYWRLELTEAGHAVLRGEP